MNSYPVRRTNIWTNLDGDMALLKNTGSKDSIAALIFVSLLLFPLVAATIRSL
jgi:hypothetical protein